MSRYERQCRWLLRAFPAEFRRQRGESLIGTLLDDAPPGARAVSVATALDLVVSGARMRAVQAGAVTTLRRSVIEGVGLAAVIGLGLQAALAIASALYQAEHGVVFYVPAGAPFGLGVDPWGVQYLTTWVALALASSVAFVAGIQGQWKVAAGLSVGANAYLVTVSIHAALSIPAIRTQHMTFTATPALLSIGSVVACLAVVTAVHRRQQAHLPRSLWWLAVPAILAVAFSLAGDGNAAQGSGTDLSTAYPPQGGIMTAFQILFASAVVIAATWSLLDPRAGWAIAVLSVPFVIHQISDLTLGRFYYGHLYQPTWETALPLILATASIAAATISATLTTRRLRRT